jgi:hypothetical protein
VPAELCCRAGISQRLFTKDYLYIAFGNDLKGCRKLFHLPAPQHKTKPDPRYE